MSQSGYTNRLANSTSPYLLQHAHNPVDWWPWGPQAFAEARARDVPIFLSIGYSTCYWCHVMERESFENEQVAAILNECFVCIKVDREERPDVDDVYMAATLISTGHGGWPMSVFLEPDQLRPFYCGTYFPAQPRPGLGSMPTLPQLAQGISSAWSERRSEVLQAAESLADATRAELTKALQPVALSPEVVERATMALLQTFDRVHGGFGGAPKFPQPANLEFLASMRTLVKDEAARAAIDHALRFTLNRMAAGGIFDQVGGGFHRYAIDQHWLVPHFEKMLYDNAQLLPLYAQAFAVYQQPDDARIVYQIVQYLDREMTAPSGAFYSAQDAEVDGHEGQNYLWTAQQVRDALHTDTDLVCDLYGLTQGPNFRDPHHPNAQPLNVLRLDASLSDKAQQLAMPYEQLTAKLDTANAVLLSVRNLRKQPRLDDKILASWNGLMIAGLARAALSLNDSTLLDRAQRAATAVCDQLITSDGVLMRSWREGRTHTRGFLEDYAAVTAALVAVAKACAHFGRDGQLSLMTAQSLAAAVESLFMDDNGGCFDTANDHNELFLRARTTYDGAMPTGQSMMLHAWLDLANLTSDPHWTDRAINLLKSMSAQIATGSVASINATRGLLRVLSMPGGAERVAAFGPLPDSDQAPAELDTSEFTPVEIYADRESVTIGNDSPDELWLEVHIAPGYHIIAAEPGSSATAAKLIPLRVFLLEGTGVQVYADYPVGEPLEHAATQETIFVHHGTVRIRVALEHEGQTTGTPLLGVQFQACDDRSCQLPTTVELDVAIDLHA